MQGKVRLLPSPLSPGPAVLPATTLEAQSQKPYAPEVEPFMSSVLSRRTSQIPALSHARVTGEVVESCDCVLGKPREPVQGAGPTLSHPDPLRGGQLPSGKHSSASGHQKIPSSSQ